MTIRDRIRSISALPTLFDTMLEQALLVVREDERDDLCVVACVVSSAAWRFWHCWRTPEDNRQEHEWVVFANVMRIAEAEGLTLRDKRIATAFSFTHDSFFIPRIMEQSIRDATGEQKEQLERDRTRQRQEHMEGGARNAEFLLSSLKCPDAHAKPLFEEGEVKQCADIIREHDSWKLNPPRVLPTSDRLAVVCLEGDALWPLHPLGVLADLQRPKEGRSRDFNDPQEWHKQLTESLETLVEFRPKWKGIPSGDFIDGKSIFRTNEGHRLYSQWRQRWNLSEEQ